MTFRDMMLTYLKREMSADMSRITVKGEVSRENDVISKPKNLCLSTETKNNCLVLS